MPLPSKTFLLAACLLAFAADFAHPDVAAAERAAWRLFAQLEQTQPAAPDFLEAADAARTALPAGPLRAAADSLHAWALLHAGRRDEAQAAYTRLLDDPATPAAFAELARRWLTRLDRETVRAALQILYRRDIRYPDSLAPLDSLPPPPPRRDRWGSAWRYRPAALRRITGSDAQSYLLESPTLGRLSDLAATLAQPRPAAPSIRPVGLIRTPGGAKPIVNFETVSAPVEKGALAERTSWKGVSLVHIGDNLLLLVEGDHPFVLRKPES